MYSVKKKIRKRNMQLSGIFLLGIIVCALFILLNDSEFCDYLFTQKDLSRYELDMVKEGKCYVYDNNLLMDCIGEADSKRLYVSPVTNDLGEINYVGLYVSQDDYGLADDILQKTAHYFSVGNEEPDLYFKSKTMAFDMSSSEKALFDEYLDYFSVDESQRVYKVFVSITLGEILSSFSFASFVLIVALAILLVLLIMMLLGVGKRIFEKQMKKLGTDYETLSCDMESCSEFTHVDVSKKYLIRYTDRYEIIPVDDIVWVFQNETTVQKKLYCVIPAGEYKTYAVKIMDKNFKEHKITATQSEVNRLYETIAQAAPFAVLGYSEEIDSEVRGNFPRVVAEVEERKKLGLKDQPKVVQCSTQNGDKRMRCSQSVTLGNQNRITKSDFVKHENNAYFIRQFRSLGIAFYIIAAINIPIGFMLGAGAFSLINVAIIGGLGCGVHLGKSRACAIIITVYALLNVLLSLLLGMGVTGYLILIIAIGSIVNTYKLDGAYKKYLETGEIPVAGPVKRQKPKKEK